MNRLFNKVYDNDVALKSNVGSLSYQLLLTKVNKLSLWLQTQHVRSVCVYAQNAIDWIIVDLACLQANIVFTPIPLFFTTTQFNQLVESVKADFIFSDSLLPLERGPTYDDLSFINYQQVHCQAAEFPTGTVKITYTSGSTGNPKGVCLSKNNQFQVANSLVKRIGLVKPRHLCLLPFPTLLENIAGIYSPLIAGGTVIVVDDNERGFAGSRLINPMQLLRCISENQPDSLILVPELLQVLINGVEQGWVPPKSLKFIAVGGSKVAEHLITKSWQCNLPVYQGYGLSECGSVVSLCTADHKTTNSAGLLLPHLTASIENKELVVKGNSFLGYLEDKKSWYQTTVHTGDIATINNGSIYIQGRKKNILINSFGRNISPEWVEAELLASGFFSQAVVVGDGKPSCLAIVTPINATSSAAISQVIQDVNCALPDYAQIKHFICLDNPMQFDQGLLTANGRPKRAAINEAFKVQIDNAYLNTAVA